MTRTQESEIRVLLWLILAHVMTGWFRVIPGLVAGVIAVTSLVRTIREIRAGR